MAILPLILLVLGFVLFLLGGFGVLSPPAPQYPRFHLVSFGLACWILADILSKMPGTH